MFDSEVVKYMITLIDKLYPSKEGFLNDGKGILINLEITPVRYDLVVYKTLGDYLNSNNQIFVERKTINNKLPYEIIDEMIAYFKEKYKIDYYDMQDYSILMGFKLKIGETSNCSFISFKINVSPNKKLAGNTIEEYKKYIWYKYIEDIKNTYGYQVRQRRQAYYVRNVAPYYMSKENILDMMSEFSLETLRSLMTYIPQTEILNAYDKIESQIISDEMPLKRKKKE